MLSEMEKSTTSEEGTAMRKKHRHEINAVFKYLMQHGPKASATLVSEVRNHKGERYRNFPTRNELSNLLVKDGRFLVINQRQVLSRRNSSVWGVVGVHDSLINKPCYDVVPS